MVAAQPMARSCAAGSSSSLEPAPPLLMVFGRRQLESSQLSPGASSDSRRSLPGLRCRPWSTEFGEGDRGSLAGGAGLPREREGPCSSRLAAEVRLELNTSLLRRFCAFDLCQAFPSARASHYPIGNAQTLAVAPARPMIDQAAAVLEQSTAPGIRVDEATARPLPAMRFEVRDDGKGQILLARRSDAEPRRMLLGRSTPCVGRDKELTLLEGTLRECTEESVARVVLVTGPAGQGKSRLRYEFVSKARERSDLKILSCHADPVGAGSSLSIARQLIRGQVSLGCATETPTAEQQTALWLTPTCTRSARFEDVMWIARLHR